MRNRAASLEEKSNIETNDVILDGINGICGTDNRETCFNSDKKMQIHDMLSDSRIKFANSFITPSMIKRLACKKYANGNFEACNRVGFVFGKKRKHKSRKSRKKSKKTHKKSRRFINVTRNR